MSELSATDGVLKRMGVDAEDIPDWLVERMRTSPVHAWLVKAEAEAAKSDREQLASDIKYATEFAAAVNGKLTALGITPITEAYADELGNLIPALLVNPDRENELHGVHATWDEDAIEARLLIDQYEETGELDLGRLLHTPLDVVRARREGPAPTPEPSPSVQRHLLRGIAMRGTKPVVHANTSDDADAITAGLAALTAAVLHVGDRIGEQLENLANREA